MQHFVSAKCSILKIRHKIGLTTHITGVTKTIFCFITILAAVKQLNKLKAGFKLKEFLKYFN
ncbi:hypothetical protein D0T85_20665 [Bacteroides sp. 519]|nr:hypothetical protein [Bacteroides sp. 519]